MGDRLSFSLPPAMQYPAYRAFWLGMLASVSGFQILRFGQFWLIFELTGSPLALGYVGLANGVPAIFLNLFGGVAADRMDQRRLIYVTQTITAILIFLLAVITLMGMVEVWHLLTISFLAGGVEAFDQPARRSPLAAQMGGTIAMVGSCFSWVMVPPSRPAGMLLSHLAGFLYLGILRFTPRGSKGLSPLAEPYDRGTLKSRAFGRGSPQFPAGDLHPLGGVFLLRTAVYCSVLQVYRLHYR